MRLRSALTLIELLLVIGLISVVSASAVYLSSTFRTRQALTSSAEDIVTNIRRAHVFSRESKDDRDWGIRRKSDKIYVLVSRDNAIVSEVNEYAMHEPIVFVSENFEIWFDQGTGETANTVSIGVKSPKGEIKTIVVSKTGSASIQ